MVVVVVVVVVTLRNVDVGKHAQTSALECGSQRFSTAGGRIEGGGLWRVTSRVGVGRGGSSLLQTTCPPNTTDLCINVHKI